MSDTPQQLDLIDMIAAKKERDVVMVKFEESRKPWLVRAREVAEELWARSHEPVTVNDIREVLPPPEGVDPRVFGAVLNRKRWRCIGYTQSDRKVSHARPIAKFVPIEAL